LQMQLRLAGSQAYPLMQLHLVPLAVPGEFLLTGQVKQVLSAAVREGQRQVGRPLAATPAIYPLTQLQVLFTILPSKLGLLVVLHWKQVPLTLTEETEASQKQLPRLASQM
jgi:hypothetical protein